MKSPLFSFALVIVIIYCETSFFLFGSIIVYTLTTITKPALASMDENCRFLILDLRAIFVRIICQQKVFIDEIKLSTRERLEN